ncbi:MAG: energy-coupled thiamine transporter ThiT [Clostridia bacterium]|nr:energy-coupled thiamine transporter ThiT [Clostridia bacterium]
MKTNTKTNLLTLIECAMMVALSFVLSLIKLWEMPFGGSITFLSMLPVCVASLRHGAKWGLGTAFVYSITQAAVSGAAGWGLSPTVLIVCYLLDYILAFTVLGLCGTARGKGLKSKTFSVATVCVMRFICHYLSGVTIWKGSGLEHGIANSYIFSLLYNGGYMLPETVFTVAGAYFIIKALESRKLL